MPPPGESNYPRAQLLPVYGTGGRLRALGDAYYGLSWVFVLNVFLFVVAGAISVPANNINLFLAGLILAAVIVGLVSFRYTRKLAFGMGWSVAGAIVSSIIIGSTLGGIITYVVLQALAAQEIKKYGVKSGAFGFRKKAYKAILDERLSLEASQPVAPAYQAL